MCSRAAVGIDTVSYANATSGANGQGVTVNLALTTAQNTIRAGTDTLAASRTSPARSSTTL